MPIRLDDLFFEKKNEIKAYFFSSCNKKPTKIVINTKKATSSEIAFYIIYFV